MKKKEIIWREILTQVLEKKERQFTQKDLAKKLKVSLSTCTVSEFSRQNF